MKTIICAALVFAFISISCGEKAKNNVSEINKKAPVEIKTDGVEMFTSDNIRLAGNYFYVSGSEKTRQPLIVLIHQFRSNKEQWSKNFTDSLVLKGYKVMAFDLRSHGESDKAKVDIEKLLTDSEQTPKDVDAVMKWAFNNEGVDTTKIGFAGTSIGGALSFYGRLKGGKSAVLVSTGKLTFAPLTGYDDRMMTMTRPLLRISNVMLIAGDGDGEHASENKEIRDNFLINPMELKIYNSDKHGKDLIVQNPEIYSLILNWFGKTL